ncbi:hypothetical protein NAP1_14348 [Erythrobacter sp. NAP1]|nr:hypothetical protein NAP1_14348 [Erythrobacter sp. NAP1]
MVLHVNLALALCDLEQRWLGNEKVPGLHDLRHLAMEEGEQQRANVSAVDVSVGHDHDLVIAQLFEVEFVANAGAHRLDQRADLAAGDDPVETRAFDVEDLASQREDRLVLAVTPTLGRAACAIALDQEQFGLGRIAFAAIGKLAGERGDAHRALAAHLASALCGFTSCGGVDDLLNDRLRISGVFFQPLVHLLAHQRLKRLAHFGRDKLVLGLRGELGVGQFDADNRCQAFAHVFTRKRDLRLRQEPRTLGIVVERAGQRGAEGGKVRAPVALRDVVGEAQHIFVVAVVPFQSDVDADPVLLGRNRNRVLDQCFLVAVEPLYECGDAAFVEQVMLDRLFVAQVADEDTHARIEESELAIAVLKLFEVELGHVLESVGRGLEGHARALLVAVVVGILFDLGRIAFDFEAVHRIAMLKAHPMLLAITPDDELEPFGQRVHDRHAHAVKAARHLVGVVVGGVFEFTACVKLGHDDLCCRHAFFLVHVDRNAAAIVFDRNAAIGVQFDQNEVTMPCERFVDGVVRNLEHHVVQARAIVGVADIHARALTHCVQALENLDGIGAVIALHLFVFGRACAVFGGVVFHTRHIGAQGVIPKLLSLIRGAFPRPPMRRAKWLRFALVAARKSEAEKDVATPYSGVQQFGQSCACGSIELAFIAIGSGAHRIEVSRLVGKPIGDQRGVRFGPPFKLARRIIAHRKRRVEQVWSRAFHRLKDLRDSGVHGAVV